MNELVSDRMRARSASLRGSPERGPRPTGDDLVLRRIRVADGDVVWLRSILEGYEGLALLTGDGSGVVEVRAPESRARELDELLAELASESTIALLF